MNETDSYRLLFSDAHGI